MDDNNEEKQTNEPGSSKEFDSSLENHNDKNSTEQLR